MFYHRQTRDRICWSALLTTSLIFSSDFIPDLLLSSLFARSILLVAAFSTLPFFTGSNVTNCLSSLSWQLVGPSYRLVGVLIHSFRIVDFIR